MLVTDRVSLVESTACQHSPVLHMLSETPNNLAVFCIFRKGKWQESQATIKSRKVVLCLELRLYAQPLNLFNFSP